MTDTRCGKPVVGQFRHSIPSEAVLLAAPPKRSTPEVSDVMPERRKRPAIRGYRIVGEVTCYDLPQPASLIWDSLVHSLPQLRLDFLELRPHAVAPGLPLKLEGSPSGFAADEGKAQESEGPRSNDAAFPAVGRRTATESSGSCPDGPTARMPRTAHASHRESDERRPHARSQPPNHRHSARRSCRLGLLAVASVLPTDRIRSASRRCQGAVRSPNLGPFHCPLRLRLR